MSEKCDHIVGYYIADTDCLHRVIYAESDFNYWKRKLEEYFHLCPRCGEKLEKIDG